jgi:hypothetical protein
MDYHGNLSVDDLVRLAGRAQPAGHPLPARRRRAHLQHRVEQRHLILLHPGNLMDYHGNLSVDDLWYDWPGGFDCHVWTKDDFITYYEDARTGRPVKWVFYTGTQLSLILLLVFVNPKCGQGLGKFSNLYISH